MTDMIPPIWSDRSSNERLTGTWRSALPRHINLPSPCHDACPIDGRIAEWIGQLAKQDVRGAWETLMDNNPFPALIGRICHHPCQSVCNRGEWDETVGICSLERFVGDAALAAGWSLPKPSAARREKVAIVGGGPAGLSAAYHLLRAGIQVTVFEKKARLGGLLRYGIPDYRLNKSVLDQEIDRLVSLGLKVKTNADVADAKAIAALEATFDFVFLATGAQRSKQVPVLEYDAPYVMDSAAFLAAINAGETPAIGAHLLVIGGGSAAMDVARSARRLGHRVTVIALEPKGALPAQKTEIAEAREEGVDMLTGAMVTGITPAADGLKIDAVRVTFQKGENRKFSVTPVDGSAFILSADGIIPAIGQDADLSLIEGVVSYADGIASVDAKGRTSREKFFAGGDLASGDRFVSHAIGMGKHAAQEILKGLKVAPPPVSDAQTVPFQGINTAYQISAPRHVQTDLPVAARAAGFEEVQQTLGTAAAMAESLRCFSCGTCTECDNCFHYCPDMAISKVKGGYLVSSDYCKGCGLCVAECPTGAVQMYDEGLVS